MKNEILIILLAILLFCACAGCGVKQHKGEVIIHDPNHIEAILDRPMKIEVESNGIKIVVDSRKESIFEDILKFLLLKD